ncbi:hypothetical protein JQ631_18915 [Bradyrhizobium manausense]|uniref:hypothetical protein n=1 Tax=Bradyrhizobium manausense TaxID=989370 RepID=UPI001BAE41E9|nr:hypothetical protein [Bradyrhizobium manausense]MBR0791154.1 hypothetical protein [Bradyrhizobium manausense]
MAGLDPAIHALPRSTKNVDARDEPGHDDSPAGARSGKIEFENLERFHRYVRLDFRLTAANMARSGRACEKPQR